MAVESARRAAQEYLAAKLSEEGQLYEDTVNLEASIALGPRVWKRLADTVLAHFSECNSVTGEQSLSSKETALGDLRIRCAGREYYQMYVHYAPKTRLVTIENTAPRRRASHQASYRRVRNRSGTRRASGQKQMSR
jgi:hypothetical protein